MRPLYDTSLDIRRVLCNNLFQSASIHLYMLILETGEDILLDMAPVWDHTDHQHSN